MPVTKGTLAVNLMDKAKKKGYTHTQIHLGLHIMTVSHNLEISCYYFIVIFLTKPEGLCDAKNNNHNNNSRIWGFMTRDNTDTFTT